MNVFHVIWPAAESATQWSCSNVYSFFQRLSAVPPAPPRCLTPRSYGSADCTTHLNLAHAHKKLSPGSGSLSLTPETSAPTDKGEYLVFS